MMGCQVRFGIVLLVPSEALAFWRSGCPESVGLLDP